ncbi:Ms4527A family Cys-rich leader peptide [Rhodococcus parequi]|uniref:Ms4527A family Cys-rich leader peptide n=1 Tax=Rhodococcus parequi TaxID=3137122 RepID=UPI003B3B6A5A
MRHRPLIHSPLQCPSHPICRHERPPNRTFPENFGEICSRWSADAKSRGRMARMTDTGVRLVARRHVDLKRVCSCCCLPCGV